MLWCDSWDETKALRRAIPAAQAIESLEGHTQYKFEFFAVDEFLGGIDRFDKSEALAKFLPTKDDCVGGFPNNNEWTQVPMLSSCFTFSKPHVETTPTCCSASIA